MRKTDVDEPNQALGAPTRPAAPKPPEPQWKPLAGHPAHETDGKNVQLKSGLKTP